MPTCSNHHDTLSLVRNLSEHKLKREPGFTYKPGPMPSDRDNKTFAAPVRYVPSMSILLSLEREERRRSQRNAETRNLPAR